MIATLTPEQFQSQAIAWMKAIGAVAAFAIAGLATFWAIYGARIKQAIQDIKSLKASADLHEKQIAVNQQNIVATALATPAPVALQELPEAKEQPSAPLAPMIPSQNTQPPKP